MSYSFNLRAATKAALVAAVAAQLDAVVAGQPCHAADRAQAQAAAESFINVIPDDDTRDASLSMSGSLSGVWTGNGLEVIRGVQLSVSAGLVDRPVAVAE